MPDLKKPSSISNGIKASSLDGSQGIDLPKFQQSPGVGHFQGFFDVPGMAKR